MILIRQIERHIIFTPPASFLFDKIYCELLRFFPRCFWRAAPVQKAGFFTPAAASASAAKMRAGAFYRSLDDAEAECDGEARYFERLLCAFSTASDKAIRPYHLLRCQRWYWPAYVHYYFISPLSLIIFFRFDRLSLIFSSLRDYY